MSTGRQEALNALVAAAAVVRIVVVKLPFATDCLVVPPIAFASQKNADIVLWTNHTGGTIHLFLPAGVADGALNFDIPDGGYQAVPVGGGRQDIYPYQVRCDVTASFAIGNSAPIIIID